MGVARKRILAYLNEARAFILVSVRPIATLLCSIDIHRDLALLDSRFGTSIVSISLVRVPRSSFSLFDSLLIGADRDPRAVKLDCRNCITPST